MSNALAIAGVTAVLKDLLNDGLINQKVSDSLQFKVSAQPPDRLARLEETSLENRLNLFLYRVSPNTGWTNERLPARSSSGSRLSNPYLALDLSYLLSAYGVEDLQAELLLGFGMQLLHETPVLPRERIRHSLTPSHPKAALLPTPFSDLDADELADQLEQIRISPWHHDTEEMSRLWSSLNTGLRPSALYKVTVVLIESKLPVRSGPPVKERRLYVPVLQRPRIERLLSIPPPHTGEPLPGLQIHHGHRLVIEGSGLRGESTRLRLGNLLIVGPALLGLTDRRLAFDLPVTLPAGPVVLQVEHLLVKAPPAPAGALIPWAISNSAAFALAPSFSSPPALEGVPTEAPPGIVAGKIKLIFAHAVGEQQKVELLLDEVAVVPAPDREAFSFTFAAVRVNPAPATYEAGFGGVPKAIYLVRARIDGVASEVRVATGMGLPADIAALAAQQIYSDPVVVFS